MAGRMTVTGTEELAAMLNRIGEQANRIASQALYSGAGVVADAYRGAANGIRARPRGKGESRTEARYPTPEEKEALKIGVARFKRDGDSTTTVVGVAEGYTTVGRKRKAYKQIANAINSGTAFMKRQPVFRKALNSSRAAAESAMTEAGEKLIKELGG